MEMDGTVMIVLIVAISVGAGVVNNYLKLRNANRRNVDQDRELEAVKAEVARLSDRVKVLEKITVDADRQLSAEISRLR
jgi:cell division protein FtsB